jgi:hypothetical protein
LAVLPGEAVVQAARREDFEKLRPDAAINRWPGHGWTGSLIVCRKRMDVTRHSLELLLDGLVGLVAIDAEAIAIEAEFSGWRLWLSSVNRWWATRQGPDVAWTRGVSIPITVSGDDLAGLRAQLVAAKGAADAAAAAAGGPP